VDAHEHVPVLDVAADERDALIVDEIFERTKSPY
jgi:hypothetical protein